MHLPHRRLRVSPRGAGGHVLENDLLGLARLFLLDGLVGRVVQPAPFRPDAVVREQGLPHRLGDLHHLLLEQRGGAERGMPRGLSAEAAEEGEDGRHLGHRLEGGVRLARIAEVVADAPVHLVVIRRAAHPALEIAEILHQQVAGAVLPDLEIVAARVDGAEDARKRLDEQVVLADVAPHLLPAQRAGGEALEVALNDLGGLTAWKIGMTEFILVGLMSVFTVVRHTRTEEETGRQELLGAAVVGPYTLPATTPQDAKP